MPTTDPAEHPDAPCGEDARPASPRGEGARPARPARSARVPVAAMAVSVARGMEPWSSAVVIARAVGELVAATGAVPDESLGGGDETALRANWNTTRHPPW